MWALRLKSATTLGGSPSSPTAGEVVVIGNLEREGRLFRMSDPRIHLLEDTGSSDLDRFG